MKPKKYNSTPIKPLVSVEMRLAKTGEMFFLVSYLTNESKESYVTFEKMSSVIDFIKSNF